MATLARLDHKETLASGAKGASLVLLVSWAELALPESVDRSVLPGLLVSPALLD
jgi:hypothetical protein